MAKTSIPERPARVVVLGLGNPIMGDDGLGLAALARLQEQYAVPPHVELVDGGTWGMNLLPMIEDATELLLIDAIRTGAEPGTVQELGRAELPRYLAHKLSPHQIDLKEVLALAELRGTLPPVITAIGAEPDRVEMSAILTPVLEASVDEVAARVARRLASWGHPCPPRPTAIHA